MAKTSNQNFLPVVMLRRIKLQNTTLDSLTQADDCDESTSQITDQKKPGTKETASRESCDLTFVGTMSKEEVNNHIQKCIEMSSENKITPKNAFALQLIDCMNFLLQKEDFSVIACTLDAGQKIYAYRVDGLHQQVIKLAEEVINNHKDKKARGEEDSTNEREETLIKERRKTSKRNILATSESLRRTLKDKDPKEKFVKVDGLPGAIISAVKRDPADLSFSLDNSIHFWHDLEDYKPLKVDGTVTIPDCEIYCDKDEFKEKENCFRFSPTQEQIEKIGNDSFIASTGELSDDIVRDGLELNDILSESGESNENQSFEEEISVISKTVNSLNEDKKENEDFNNPHFDAMIIVSNRVSDYHYLNMEKSYYWAGPEFWKRPKMPDLSSKERKKAVRKKKDPIPICYDSSKIEEANRKFLKKASPLNEKTVNGWKTKSYTYPNDLKIGVNQFLDLFFMLEFFELGESPQSSKVEVNPLETEIVYDNPLQENATVDFSDRQDPLNSSFYEHAPENSASPDHSDPLNSAFYDAGLTQESDTMTLEGGKIIKVQFSETQNSDATLVPAPKVVKFQPIKYKTKPIRVDMQHLKQTMFGIIKENNQNHMKGGREITLGNPESLPTTKLSQVLRQLPGRLEKRTEEDLSPGMALLALLTLANENNLQLKNTDNYTDVEISLERTHQFQ